MQPQVPGPDRATAEAGTPPIAPARGAVYGRATVLPTAVGAADQPGAGTSESAGPGAAAPCRRSRTLLISVLGTIVVLVLVTAVLGLVRPGPVKNWLAALGP